jgi:uncharacterized UPF0160 family protein
VLYNIIKPIWSKSAVKGWYDCDSSGEIICLPSGGLPWKSEVYELESELEIVPLIKYVLYEDQSQMWGSQCASVKGRAFENQLGLPTKWRGVRDEDLSKIAALKVAHSVISGFIGGNKSYEGVLEMAQVALVGEG